MMKAYSKFAHALICSSLLLFCSAPAHAASIFDFSSTGDDVPLPLTLTHNGLTATFTGEAHVCVIDDPEVLFATLHGPAVIQDFCGDYYGRAERGPLGISFSEKLSSLSFNFATSREAATLTVELFEDGVGVGSDTFSSSFPPDFGNGEGVASISGTFNSVVLLAPTVMAYDNVDAVVAPALSIPEPSTIVDCCTGAALLATFLRRSKLVTKPV